jgi:citrate lyase subunit beta/citryl-CoA lyase
MELLRSLIFVPGNRPNMLERAFGFNADVVMVDLEDSVPPGEKVDARELVRQWIPRLRREGRRVMVRLNSLDTGLTRDELAVLMGPDPSSALGGSGQALDGVSIGKAESVQDIHDADQMMAALESAAGMEVGQVKLIPWIENARAVVAAYQMATASARIIAVAFGAEDYTNDMGLQRTDTGEEVYFPRAMVAVAARAANVPALDSPFVGFRDPDGLRQDIQVIRQLGYTGKFAIHPAQLDIINEAFSPSTEEVAYAQRVVDAWNRAEAQGRGSADLDGRMIDVPVFKRAQNLLAQAETIEAARG